MKIKILTPNKDGKFEFTKEELEKLLEESYNEGYTEGNKNSYIPVTPPIPNPITTPNIWYNTKPSDAFPNPYELTYSTTDKK